MTWMESMHVNARSMFRGTITLTGPQTVFLVQRRVRVAHGHECTVVLDFGENGGRSDGHVLPVALYNCVDLRAFVQGASRQP